MAKIPENGFSNHQQLNYWLNTQPEERWATCSMIIGHRAALRALPFVGKSHSSKVGLQSRAEAPTLAVFQLSTISRLALYAFMPPMPDVIDNAVRRASLPFDPAAQAAVSAAYTTMSGHPNSVAAEATGAAASAFVGPNSAEYWRAVTADAETIEQRIDPLVLRRAALWPNGEPGFWSAEVRALRSDLLSHESNDGGWQVWLDWFENVSAGQSEFGLPMNIAGEIELKIATGNGRDGFWEQAPAEINAEIANWVSDARQNVELMRLVSGGDIQRSETRPDLRAVQTPEVSDGTLRELRKRQVDPQTGGAVHFEAGEDERIGVSHRGSVDGVSADARSIKRHSEALRMTDALIFLMRDKHFGNNALGEFASEVALFREALGADLTAMDADFLIPRGDGLRKTLAAHGSRDDFSKLDPIPDDVLLALDKAIRPYNQFVSLDDALARRDEALFGPDAKLNLIAPDDGQARVLEAVSMNAAKREVLEVLEAEASVAPAVPDPESRASRRYSEGNKNFVRRAMEGAIRYVVEHPGRTAAGGAGALYASAQWVWLNREWLLNAFANNPNMLEILRYLLDILKHMPLA